MRKRQWTLFAVLLVVALVLFSAVLVVTEVRDDRVSSPMLATPQIEHVAPLPERKSALEASVAAPAAIADERAARPQTNAVPTPQPSTLPAVPEPAEVPTTGDLLGIPSMSMVESTGSYQLYASDGYMLVNLRGGKPALFPFGGPSTDKERAVRGRVTDRSGKPVAGAIVFSDRGVSIRLDTIMALAATVTDANGEFALTDAPADECFVIALAADDWSALIPCGDEPLELPILGHGSLAARITYDGEPETFDIHLGTRDRRFGLSYTTSRSGSLKIPSLPPGTYVASVGLAQSVGGGRSKTSARQITIVDGKVANLELDLAGGTTVVLQATPPKETAPKGITYWLFVGAAPKDGAEARARAKREGTTSMTVGAGATLDPVQLHDIAPGRYWACAAFFDPATMNALDKPFGCKPVTISAGDAVREVKFGIAT